MVGPWLCRGATSFYTGQTDGLEHGMGDGTHVYNADTSELSFGWRQTTLPPTSGWFAIAVAFRAAPLAVRHRHRSRLRPTADCHPAGSSPPLHSRHAAPRAEQ